MTEAERIARAHRAQSALDEFITPAFTALREDYTDKLSHVATTELATARRTDMISTLAVALKVVDTVHAGLREIVKDGQLASQSRARADEVRKMSDAAQRLLKIGSNY